jgi:hypothetical protein
MRLRKKSHSPRRNFATAAVLAAGLLTGCAKLPAPDIPARRPAPVRAIKEIPLEQTEKPVMKSVQMRIPPQDIRMARRGDMIFTAIRDNPKKPIAAICSIDSIDKKGVWLSYDDHYPGAPDRVAFGQPAQIGQQSMIQFDKTNTAGVIKVTITGIDPTYPVKNPGGIMPFLPVIRP